MISFPFARLLVCRNYFLPFTLVNHTHFLDYIVKSSLDEFRMMIRESLAILLRIDAPTDRTPDHNTFLMINVVSLTQQWTHSFGFPCFKNWSSHRLFRMPKKDYRWYHSVAGDFGYNDIACQWWQKFEHWGIH